MDNVLSNRIAGNDGCTTVAHDKALVRFVLRAAEFWPPRPGSSGNEATRQRGLKHALHELLHGAADEPATWDVPRESVDYYPSRVNKADDISVHQIREWLSIFATADHVMELRALEVREGTWRPYIVSGFFDRDHLGDMASAAVRWSRQAKGVYFTLNPVNRDLLARRCNRADRAGNDTTTDKNVVSRRWLLIDVDPQRVAGVSATDEEKDLAHAKILAVRDFLAKSGWPAPILADSGNGYHLLYRIDLPAADGELVKRILHALASRFDDDRVKVDTSVFNPQVAIFTRGRPPWDDSSRGLTCFETVPSP